MFTSDALNAAFSVDAFQMGMGSEMFRQVVSGDLFRSVFADNALRGRLVSDELGVRVRDVNLRQAFRNDDFRSLALSSLALRQAFGDEQLRAAWANNADAFRGAVDDALRSNRATAD